MSESMIIGVDHGYAAMKTAHFSFPSGLVAYEHEPYTLKDVLEYGGKFYVVGSGRQEFDYASILEGEGLQMLIYLFALRKYGAQRYGKPLIPAGVLYVPSRSDMERVDPGESPEDIQALRQKKKRRKGLVLADGTHIVEPAHGQAEDDAEHGGNGEADQNAAQAPQDVADDGVVVADLVGEDVEELFKDRDRRGEGDLGRAQHHADLPEQKQHDKRADGIHKGSQLFVHLRHLLSQAHAPEDREAQREWCRRRR